MLTQIVSLLVGTVANLLAVALLARVWMQWSRAPFRNPIGQFIIAVTDWIVVPLRRIIPGLFGIDLASVLAGWLILLAYFSLMSWLTGLGAEALPGVLWLATVILLRTLVYLLMGIIIIAAVLSWINPHTPFAPLFDALSRPLLYPVRRVLPALGGVDLSPLVVLLLLEVGLIVLANLLPGGYRW